MFTKLKGCKPKQDKAWLGPPYNKVSPTVPAKKRENAMCTPIANSANNNVIVRIVAVDGSISFVRSFLNYSCSICSL